MRRARLVLTALFAAGVGTAALAQQGASPGAPRPALRTRPPLFFREEWRQTSVGGEHPVTPESVSNPALELKLYGASSKDIQLTGSAADENNPIHLWTGLCTAPCAVALRDRSRFADLSGLGRIKWVTKVSGFHRVRPIVKLADGTWLVGDREDGSPTDWLTSEFALADARWLRLDIDRVVTKGNLVEKPDLTKVDEVGFADLLPGSGHGPGGWIDVAAIEVYARPVPR